MVVKTQERECPYCKEEIKTDAIKCKHCHSSITPETPKHEGTCPYCKETINPDAIKCKHCKSMLLEKSTCDCSGTVNLNSVQKADLVQSLLRDSKPGSGGGPTCEGTCMVNWIDCIIQGRQPQVCSLEEFFCKLLCDGLNPRPGTGIGFL